MGKVSPKEKSWKGKKGRKQLRSSKNKYLKPGTLAQLRCNRSSGSGGGGGGGGKACTDLGKKRVAVGLNSRETVEKSPVMLSPVNLVRQNSLVGTPKTPRIEEPQSDSRLESLPMDVLVCLIFPILHSRVAILFIGNDYWYLEIKLDSD